MKIFLYYIRIYDSRKKLAIDVSLSRNIQNRRPLQGGVYLVQIIQISSQGLCLEHHSSKY